MNRRLIATCCLIASLLAQPAPAQDQGEDAQIREAIRRGVAFLKRQQLTDGTWTYPGHELGITALAGLALVENGVTLDDRALRNAYDQVSALAPSNVSTYDLSLAILFLSRTGRSEDKELIQQLGARLAAGQLSSGGWSYNVPHAAPTPPAASVTNKPRNTPEPVRRAGRLNAAGGGMSGFGDNSNTQFAVLGIWAAGRAGLDVKENFVAVEKRFRGSQSPQGGWGYNGPRQDSDAMTCAGLMALLLAKGHRTIEGQMSNRRPDKDAADGPNGTGKMESDANIEKGIRRLEAYASGMNPASSFYFLWSVERVGMALGTPRIGQVEWYERGASLLLKLQHADGSWLGGSGHGRGELTDTSFALLFLRRSNLAQGAPQLATGRVGGTSDGNKMRAGGLEDLIRSVREPEKPTARDAKKPDEPSGTP